MKLIQKLLYPLYGYLVGLTLRMISMAQFLDISNNFSKNIILKQFLNANYQGSQNFIKLQQKQIQLFQADLDNKQSFIFSKYQSMIKGVNLSHNNLNNQYQKTNRYENIHKNFVLPQDKFYAQQSYQNNYQKKQVDFNDLRGVVQKPKSTIEPRKFQGNPAYNDAYKKNENFIGRQSMFKKQDNIKVSTQPFIATSEYNDRLKGQKLYTKNERTPLPRNQIFPKGSFDGTSSYNNTYLQNEIHKQPQFKPQGQLKIGNSKFQANSSYLNDYSRGKEIVKPQKFIQRDNQILPKGIFNGQSTYGNAYISSKIQPNTKFIPLAELKVGGRFQGQSSYLQEYGQKQYLKVEQYRAPQNQTIPKGRFQGQSSYNSSYTGTKAQKAYQFKPQQQWKVQGNFEGNSSYMNDYKQRDKTQRCRIVSMPNNKFMPEGPFQSNSNYQANYIQYEPTHQRQIKPQGQLKIGGTSFQGTSNYTNQYQSKGLQHTEKFKPKQNQVMPKGKFQGESNYHQNYIQSSGQRGQSYKPKPELLIGGKFEGNSSYNAQFSEKKGIRAERTPLPINQVIPQGRFNGQSMYTNAYIPTTIQRRQQIKMQSELKVGEGQFQGNSNYAQNYQYSPIKNQSNQMESNNGPRWNKKAQRWQ